MSTYKDLIPISRPSIGREEINEVEKVFVSRWLGLGAWTLRFEEELKRFLGADNAIAVNTGTTALHLALDSIGINKGDEVIVPSLTFAASAQAIIAAGARPVFCDIEEDTFNMDVGDMQRRISARTRAVMPVHYGGLACDMDRILEISREKGIRVVEDAAHAFGSSYKGKKIGSFGDVTCFSFDPIKNITCGEGGAVVTVDKELMQVMYKKRILGIDKDTWSRYKHKREWFYNVTTSGYRYHMSNINAAIGLVQLRKIEGFIDRKKQIVQRYDNEFRGIADILLLKRDYAETAPFNYVLRVKRERDRLIEFLKERGIDSGVHYIPNHIQPFFEPYKSVLPVTEMVWQEMLTLPLYSEMSEEDLNKVVGAVKDFFK
ncbi:MAG: DegT/DnrJ/EryC1/StrS aminotransferase family protein [Candidatus Omnitrophica bacterium]|nr:DegT/DnrJ/EryC1/StrS aminotransferase family protein [Candidatus Omnitrophota bacterium]